MRMLLLLAVSGLSWLFFDTPENTSPIPIKVVVVTMFESGSDTGDKPGEFQLWVEGLPLKDKMPFPQGYRDLCYNAEKGILGIVVGTGSLHATASIMALGMDTRFDLSKAYWIINGIAGIDPEDGSAGAAVWADYVVDGDMAFEIDAREMPAEWPTGYFPIGTTGPYQKPLPSSSHNVFHLNDRLVNWAYTLTKDIKLPDHDSLKAMRKGYSSYPNALRPPQVMRGAELSAMTYWHGKVMNAWANQWVEYWTEGKGNFTTTAMEDSGILTALNYLGKAGKADAQRVLVLRTASDFSVQAEGETAIGSLKNTLSGHHAALAAFRASWLVGSKVVNEWVDHWDKYEAELPE